jgi:hypothetical protein
MARHVTDEALFEVLEGAGRADATAHAASCGACAARLDEARAGLALARGAEVPEPSPLYWEAFRRSVARKIESDGSGGARRFVGWSLVAAAAAAAIVVVVLRPPVMPSATPSPMLPAWSALPPADQDEGLAVLQGLAEGDGELAAVRGERLVVDSLVDLSDEEVQAVGDALRRDRREGDL